MSWERRAREALHAALGAAGEFATRQAQEEASDMGWPREMSSRLHAVTDGGRLAVSYEGAEDWEEGTPDRPPRPAARTVEAQHRRTDQIFADVIESSLREHL